MIRFGTSGYQTDQFDNLSVILAGSSTPTGHIIASEDTAECADVNGGSAADGTKVQMWKQGTQLDLWTGNGGSNQQWSVP